MSVQNISGDGCGNTSGLDEDQSATLFSVTCTGSCYAGSIPAAGVGCIAAQPTTDQPL
jgi:hypothetical protein